MRFQNKAALVTGAGGGIGEGYAEALAKEGAALVIAEIACEQGERVAREIRGAGGKALFVETDVSSEASCRKMAEASRKAFGGVDYDGIRGMILRQLVPKRMGEVDDIVKACLFLLSDEASWITAQIMAVDGGQVMRV